MRLNRFLSQCGVASRRGAEQIILEGRVSINGHIITELATQVAPEDKVIVDGKPVQTETPVVIALHKPKGYICSRGDTHDRMTIYDLLPLKMQNLHHVGRLDKDSEGLILLTNRGDLSHKLIHPSQGAEKEYEVVTDKPMDHETMARLVKGMLTEEGHARAERAWLDGAYHAHVVLKQGLKRQIRLMFYQLGFEVVRLVRIRIGWLTLKNLAKGAHRILSPAEVEKFFKDDDRPRREAPRVRKPEPSPAREDEKRPRGPRERSFDREAGPPRRGKPGRPGARSSDRQDGSRSSSGGPRRGGFGSGGATKGGRARPPSGPRRGQRPR